MKKKIETQNFNFKESNVFLFYFKTFGIEQKAQELDSNAKKKRASDVFAISIYHRVACEIVSSGEACLCQTLIFSEWKINYSVEILNSYFLHRPCTNIIARSATQTVKVQIVNQA